MDTEGNFRPERIHTIAERFGLDPNETLDNVYVARVFNHEQQIERTQVRQKGIPQARVCDVPGFTVRGFRALLSIRSTRYINEIVGLRGYARGGSHGHVRFLGAMYIITFT